MFTSDLGNILHSDSAESATAKLSTFYSLKDKLVHLMFSAIECETDSNNVQLLLHALTVFVSDIGTKKLPLQERERERAVIIYH